MSKDRILGSAVHLQIYGGTGTSGGMIAFAELDSFSSKNKTTLKQNHPLGEVVPHGQLIYDGYELSFEVGKVDASLEVLQNANDQALLNGQSAPRYQIVDQTNLLDGTTETWVYPNVVLHDFDVTKAMGNEEIKQKCNGFAPARYSGGVLATLNPTLSGDPNYSGAA